MQHKAIKAEKKGLADTYVLTAKLKGHQTWRIVGHGRYMIKIEAMYRELRDRIVDWELYKMNGATGKMMKVKKPK